MSASNFYYQNRCIVVTNDDYEIDNLPGRKNGCYSYDRNYPSTELEVSDDFDFWDIVITAGYYEDACIDYVRSEHTVEDNLGSSWAFETLKEFQDDCRKFLGITPYRLRKLCGNLGDQSLEDYIEDAYEKISDYLAEQEEDDVNKKLDEIKQYYGYKEYGRVGTFSNGETLYREIG